MPLDDTQVLRELLTRLYPGLIIEGTPIKSGQRAVYYCRFNPSFRDDDQEYYKNYNEWLQWGSVVLKISQGVSVQSIAYIQREIEILKSIDGNGFPKLYHDEVITDDPDTEERFRYRYFITIEERLDAKPLSDVMHEFNDEASVIELLYKIFVIMKPLWELTPPIVHRDLKPANLLITDNNNVHVIDLGIAREEGEVGVTLTACDVGPCTVDYASPEQATNDKRNISFRSDLFSLGILSYELISGTNPFRDKDYLYDLTIQNILKLEPVPLHDLGLCGAELSGVINKMLRKKPFERYRKLTAFEQDLNDLRSRN